MRHDTKVWARFQSSGYPRLTSEDINDSVRNVVLAFGKWILATPMNKRMIIVIAAERDGLDQRVKGETELSMIELLDQMMNGEPSLGDSPEQAGSQPVESLVRSAIERKRMNEQAVERDSSLEGVLPRGTDLPTPITIFGEES